MDYKNLFDVTDKVNPTSVLHSGETADPLRRSSSSPAAREASAR